VPCSWTAGPLSSSAARAFSWWARFGLTVREQDVLAALSRGLSVAEISVDLQISRHTVKSHVHNVYLKLDVHNRLEAVRLLLLEDTLFRNPYNWL
jgi:DNA-binding CsgD family transcriptional regulator